MRPTLKHMPVSATVPQGGLNGLLSKLTPMAVLCMAAWLAVVLSSRGMVHASRVSQSVLPNCDRANPYLATTCYVRGDTFDNETAIVAFRDTPDDSDHIRLATVGQVGATWGLAYHPGRNVLYAGAFHRRNSKFGPFGPGGIYLIDLKTGNVSGALRVPFAGRDEHDNSNNYQPDNTAISGVAKTSLGDIELSEDGTKLFVMNLKDGRIYVFELASGQYTTVFRHGAGRERWSNDARPFALKVHEGWVYHGLVNSSQTGQRRTDLVAYVYASRPDGSDMRQVARIWLGYNRGMHDPWEPWHDRGASQRSSPQALLTDIEFDDQGNMIVGIRDRYIDNGPSLTEGFRVTPGDILLLRKSGAMQWTFDFDAPEHYAQDNLRDQHDELAIGGLARLMGLDVVVTTAIDPFRTINQSGPSRGAISSGAIWFDNRSGTDLGREELVYNQERHGGPYGKAQGLGDVEQVCVPSQTTPTPSASSTSTPIPTATAPKVTETATDAPTVTETAQVTSTASATQTPTEIPSATSTSASTSTSTAVPTVTPVPSATDAPSATATSIPTTPDASATAPMPTPTDVLPTSTAPAPTQVSQQPSQQPTPAVLPAAGGTTGDPATGRLASLLGTALLTAGMLMRGAGRRCGWRGRGGGLTA
jgi:hypothetical protein